MVFAVFIVLAIYYYLERTVFADIAFHTFYIIKNQSFVIQNNRFGAAITQIFPLIATKLNLPLAHILLIYSSCFIIVYGAIYSIIVFQFKNSPLALILIGYLTLMMSDTFYWIQSEYQQGCVLCLLFFAMLLHKKEVRFGAFLAGQIVLLITVVFMHPLLIFVFSFLLFYFFLIKKIDIKWVLFWIALYFLIWIFKSTIMKSPYDVGKFGGIKNVFAYFPNYLQVQSIKYFLKDCLSDYLLFVIFTSVILIYYFKSKQLIKSLFFFLSIFGYWFIVSISNAEVPNNFYIQSMYLPLGIMIFAPLVFEIFPLLNKKIIGLSMAVYLVIRLLFIINSGTWFSERLEWNKKAIAYVKNIEGNKFILEEKNIPLQKVGITWASSFETLILSSLSYPDEAVTIFIQEPTEYFDALNKEDVFFTPWDIWYGNEVPQNYFNLKNNKYSTLKANLKNL